MKRALTLLLTLAMFVSLFAVGGIQAFAAKDVEMQYMTADETETVLGTDGYTVVDLRKVADFEEAHIPGAVSVDMSAAVEGDAAVALKKIREGTAALTTLGGIGEALGGYKGYGFALFVEFLSSVLQDGENLKELDGKDGAGNIRPYHLGHFFIAIDTNHFLGEDLCRKKTGDILRKVRTARKAPGEYRIYTAGEKEYDIWKNRENSGVPINESVQGEINAVRDELGLSYVFPWEEGYAGYKKDRKIKSHIERNI